MSVDTLSAVIGGAVMFAYHLYQLNQLKKNPQPAPSPVPTPTPSPVPFPFPAPSPNPSNHPAIDAILNALIELLKQKQGSEATLASLIAAKGPTPA